MVNFGMADPIALRTADILRVKAILQKLPKRVKLGGWFDDT